MKRPCIHAILLLCLMIGSPGFAAKPKPKPQSQPTPSPVSQERLDRVINELIAKSDEAWHEGRFEDTAFLLKIVTELDPSDVETWSNRAWVLWSALQRDDEAFKVLREGIGANPKRYELYIETAVLHDHRKEYPKAAEFYSKAVSLGAPPYTRHALAHALEFSGRIEEAKETWRKTLKLDPKDDPAKSNLERLERGDIQKPAPDQEKH